MGNSVSVQRGLVAALECARGGDELSLGGFGKEVRSCVDSSAFSFQFFIASRILRTYATLGMMLDMAQATRKKRTNLPRLPCYPRRPIEILLEKKQPPNVTRDPPGTATLKASNQMPHANAYDSTSLERIGKRAGARCIEGISKRCKKRRST